MVNGYTPKDLTEALKIIDEEDCTVFAGGTDLMVRHKQWSGMEPAFDKPVVFIHSLGELKGIYLDKNYINIGSACICTEIIENSLVPQFMKSILYEMASPAVRNTATIGGNICNSSPAGDTLPLLYAMESYLVLENIHESRTVKIDDFILGPGKNSLKKNEILSEIKIPIKEFSIKAYRKIGTRKSAALSKLSFVGLAIFNNKKVEDIRIALGAVSPTVVKDKSIEKEIMDMSCTAGKIDFDRVRHLYGKVICPIDDQRSTAFYRKETSLRLIEDFLKNKAQL